jgi:hypothetical protein
MTIFIESNCIQCGRSYRGRGIKFCGKSCATIFRNLYNNPAKRKDVREKISAFAIKRGTARMMTKEARIKAAIGISRANKGRILSAAHKAAIGRGSKAAGCRPPDNSKKLVGKNHWNWQGGFSTIRNKAFNSKEYVKMRRDVLDRDNYICQDCQTRGGRLEVHHIKAWGPYPELRYVLHNCITLCKKCHKKHHRAIRRPVTVGPRILSDLLSIPV